MKKFLSFMLAFVMVVTTFVGIIPPLEVSAASIPTVSISVSKTTVQLGGSLTYTATAKGNNYTLNTVTFGIAYYATEDDYDDGAASNYVYMRNTGLSTSKKTIEGTFKTSAGSYVTGTENDGSGSRKLYTDKAGIYTLTITAYSSDYGDYVKKTKKIVVEKEEPSVKLSVSDNEIELGDSVTYTGTASGNDYKLNTVTLGIAYYATEDDYDDGAASNYVYIRNTGLSTSSKTIEGTFKTSSGSYVTGTENNGSGSRKLYTDKAGIYTITLTAYSDEYGDYVKKTKTINVIEPEKEEPSTSLSVSDNEIVQGESITYSGTANGNDYKLNTVTIGIAYYITETDYNAGSAANYVYMRNTGLSVSQKTLSGTFNTATGQYITGTENDGTGSRKLYTDKAGIYTITITAYSNEYGETIKTTKKIVVSEPEKKDAPTVELSVPQTTIVCGESFTYSGTAYGNDYILNTVTIGIAYYETESDYNNGAASNWVYIRNTGLSVSQKTLSGNFNTSSGQYVTGTENDGTGSRKLYTDQAGVYTISITAYSTEYGEAVKLIKKVTVTEPEKKDAPTVELSVLKTDLVLGDNFAYSGTANGNDYKLNTVTIGIAYYLTENDYEIGAAANYVYMRNTGLSVSQKTLSGTFNTATGQYVTGTEADGTGSRKLYTDKAGIYTITITAYSTEYGETVKETKKIVVAEPEKKDAPTVELSVSKTEVIIGESITYNGVAVGNDYKLNTVTIGFAFYANENAYNKGEASDWVYVRNTGLSVAQKTLNGTFNTASGQFVSGTENDGSGTRKFYTDRAGIYTITITAYSSEHGEAIKNTKKIIVTEPNKKTSPSVELNVSTTDIVLGDSFVYSGTAYGNDYILNTVTIGISYFSNETDLANGKGNTVYLRNTGLAIGSKEVNGTVYTGVGKYITGTTNDGSSSFTLYFDKAGIYTITLHGWSNEYGEDIKITKRVNVSEKTIVGYKWYSDALRHKVLYSDGSYDMEDCAASACVCGRQYPDPVVENPSLSEVKAIASGMTGYFTVKGNADAKYGIVLYADGYKLDKIVWTSSESNGTITYTGEHIFNQPGTRSIVVYAIDKDGNEVKGDGKFASTSIVLEPNGRCDSPIITTVNNQKLEVGNSFKVSWDKPIAPTGVTFKYNVYVDNGTTNICVAEQISANSYTIPANKLNKAGVYTISVIAMATGYQQSDDDNATINLIITDSSKKSLGTVVITSPTVGSYVDSGNELSITWKITGDVPDRYIVNITGVDSQHITVSGTTAKVAAGVLGGKGTYTISVTAEKEGYVSSIGRTSIIVECQHSQKTFIQYIYEDFKNVDATTHSVRVISKYTCDTCGATYEDRTNSTIKNESHIRDFETSDGGWTCRCGHFENKSFKSYTAYLQSDVNQPTYYDADLTVSYGLVYPSDRITVVGETDKAYLIEYSLDKGGVKTAFISKNYIDTRKYEKGSLTTVFVSGNPVKTISNSNKLYANLEELIAALGDYGELVSQNGYQVTVVIKDSRNNNPYTLSIDLSQYKTKNWADVYASQNARSVVADFCVGAYVYLGNIFIELNELLELIAFVESNGQWFPSNTSIDWNFYTKANQMLYAGSQFEMQYDAMNQNAWPLAIAAVLHHLAFDPGSLGAYLTNGYTYEKEIVDSIQATLFAQSVTSGIVTNDYCYSDELWKIVADIAAELTFAEDGVRAEVLLQKTGKELLDSIGAQADDIMLYNDLLNKCVKGASTVWYVTQSVMEVKNVYDLSVKDALMMSAICDQYYSNVALIDALIANETNEDLRRIYKRVKSEMDSYYQNVLPDIMWEISNNSDVQAQYFTSLTNLIEGTTMMVMESGAGAVVLIVSNGINTILMGDQMMSAFDGILSIGYSLQIMEPILEEALNDYYTNPTDENQKRLLNIALYVGDLRVKGAKYCYDYVTHSGAKMLWEKLWGTLEEFGGTLERADAYWDEKCDVEDLIRELEAWK